MKRFKIAIIALFVAVCVFTVGGFLLAPPLLKWWLEKNATERLHREVSIGKIAFNPYTFVVNLTGVKVKDKDSPTIFFSLDELNCDVEVMPLFRKIIAVEEIRITKPYLKIDRLEEKTYNFSDLIGAEVEKEKKPAKEDTGFRFNINSVLISNGSIDFIDRPKNTKHVIEDLNLNLPFISNLPKYIQTDIKPMLTLKVNGVPYTIEGKTKPFSDSLETIFDIKINDLNISYYLAYVPIKLNFLLPSASLDINAQLSFTRYKDKSPDLNIKGDLSLKGLIINDLENKPIINFPLLNLSITDLAPFDRRIQASKLFLVTPSVYVERFGDGKLNILSLLLIEPNKADADTKNQKAEGETLPFSLDIETLQISNGRFSFNDRFVETVKPILMENLELSAEGISLEKGKSIKITLSCLLNKGNVDIEGFAGINPVFTQAKVSFKNLDIIPFQPYFTEKVKITVIGGILSVNGDLKAQHIDDKGFSLNFTGGASLSRFASIDKLNGEDFLKWGTLFLNRLRIGYNPTNIFIDGVSLTDFYSSVIINKDGMLNITEAFTEETADERISDSETEKTSKTESAKGIDQPNQKKEKPSQIKINTVTLQNGRIDFKDLSIKPNYAAKLEEIGGRISGLSSDPGTVADVELRGKYDRYAPLEITGKINPLKEDLFIDLKVAFKDMELGPVTPYSGKHIGYAIEKGKLSLSLQYLIEKRKLKSQNNIFFDQLTLGDKVDSPDATKLPVKLAIALLKDRNGQIKLDIPVKGSLDDPEFNVWTIVIKIIQNLLVKAATAPFSLLAAMFGGGENLQYIEFDYGRESLTEDSDRKIATISKILIERPLLRVDIQGFVDMEKDKEGLKQVSFERKLKAQKLKELAKKESLASSLDEIKIEANDYEKYLRLAYKAEKFPKPKTLVLLDKTLPVPEMEKLIFAHIVIQEEDIRLLGKRRAMQVKDALLKDGNIDPSRVFTVEPKNMTPEKKENIKDSRVEFKLK